MNHSFNTDLAKEVGVQAAVIMEHIAFWIIKNRGNKVNYRNGKYWTYSTINGFKDYFDYLSYKQIRTALERLEALGYLVTGSFNAKHLDRTKWYAFGLKALRYYGERILDAAPKNAVMELNPENPLPNLPKAANEIHHDLTKTADAQEMSVLPETANSEMPETANQETDIPRHDDAVIPKTELPKKSVELPKRASGLPPRAEQYQIEKEDEKGSVIPPLSPQAALIPPDGSPQGYEPSDPQGGSGKEPPLSWALVDDTKNHAAVASCHHDTKASHKTDALMLTPAPDAMKTTLKRKKTTPENFDPILYIVSFGVSDQVARDYVTHRKTLRTAVTKTVIDQLRAKAAKYGYTLEEALIDVCEKGWRGFFPIEEKQASARKIKAQNFQEQGLNNLHRIGMRIFGGQDAA